MRNSNIQHPTSREVPRAQALGAVTQIFNLCTPKAFGAGRRFSIGKPSVRSHVSEIANALQNAILRYSRLQICVTLFACVFLISTQSHAASPTFTTLAGSAGTGSTNGTGSTALFSNPQAVATDPAGNIYVADTGNNVIRMITPGGA